MNERKQIINQINSSKNSIINGKNNIQFSNYNEYKTNTQNMDTNLIYINNIIHGPRNSTAPNNCNKRQKGCTHLRITAKNKELKNLYLSNNKNNKEKIYLEHVLSKKISSKSLSKTMKKNESKNKSHKNINKIKNIKRINSSNNIKIIDNNAIDYFTHKILEGSKTNNNIKKNIDGKSDMFYEYQLDALIQNNQNGLFNINLRDDMQNFDDKNNKIFKNKINNNNNIKHKSNKSLNNIKSLNINNNINTKCLDQNQILSISKSKVVNQKIIYNPILNSINTYKIKHSSSLNNDELVHKNNKDIKNNNNIIYNEYKFLKNSKNSKKKNIHISENDKSEFENNRNNKNLNKLMKNKNEHGINIAKNKNNNNLYQYLILKGNASYLVKYCMYHRINWVEADNPEPDNPDYASNCFNFKWKELSYGIDYHNLNKNPKMKQIVNHFEYHYVISNKANMFINMMKYCEKRNLSIFKYVPFTIVFKLKDRRKIKNKEKQKRWTQKLEKLKNLIQGIGKNVKNYNEMGKYYYDEEFIKDSANREEFEKVKQLKKMNMKSKEEEKDNKEKKIEEKYKGKFEVYSDIFPRLKIDKISKKIKSNDEKDIKDIKINRIIGSNTLIEIPDTHYKGRNMWVLKAINLNRGMCIKVVNSFEQMEKVINKFKTGVDYSNFTIEKIEEEEKLEQKENNQQEILIEDNNKDNKDIKELIINNQNIEEINENNNKSYENKKEEKEKDENEKEEKIYNCSKILIQKYIENPLLYKGRKCDMRIWVLLTHQLKVYIFKEGHLKTCSVQYDLNSKDAYTHITNYSFQKHNTNFQKFEKGNEVPFYEFQKFIDEKYPEKNYKLNKDLMKQIKEIISISMRCGKNRINKNNRNFQFEIFGYDFMLDSDFNAFLIEINTNPGLEISSPWIQIVVPRMLDDALRLTVDKVFEPIFDFNKNYKGDYTEEQKKLLIDSKIEYDFNAVNPINIINNKKDDSSSICSNTVSKFSGPTSSANNNTNSIFNINLELDEFDKNLIKEEKKDNNIINLINNINIDENKNIKSNDEDKNIKKEENKNIKHSKENKNNKLNKLKYISPFPVPGYSLDENLWDFVCDLNDKDPYDISKEKYNKEKNTFTGIRHLLKKRTNRPKNKK